MIIVKISKHPAFVCYKTIMQASLARKSLVQAIKGLFNPSLRYKRLSLPSRLVLCPSNTSKTFQFVFLMP